MSHLEFLTEPVLRELRSKYEEQVAIYARSNWNTNPSDERRCNRYRRLLREVNAELFVRTREEIARKHG